MEDRWASKQRTSVQASTSEGHRVWVVGFSAETLSRMTQAKLTIEGLRSNVTGLPFKFNPATFTIYNAPIGTPWSGGSVKDSGTAGKPAEPTRSRSDVGAPVAEGGGGGLPPAAPVGNVMVESGSSQNTPQALPPQPERLAEGRVIEDDEEENHAPKVEEWNPMDDDGGSAHRRRSGKSSSDDSASSDIASGTEPAGSQTVYVFTGVALLVFAVLYYNPQLRTMGAAGRKDRFRDIGERSSEEELGLVQYSSGRYHDDDDML
jgi:hypothetical protein